MYCIYYDIINTVYMLVLGTAQWFHNGPRSRWATGPAPPRYLRPLTMWRGTGYPVPRLLCFCQTDLLLCAISTRIPSKIPFFSVKPRRNRRSRRGQKTGDGISFPPFSTFFTERASYYVHFWHYSTVRYCCKPSTVQHSTLCRTTKIHVLYCTALYMVNAALWKSP